jgi:hypothetical protein
MTFTVVADWDYGVHTTKKYGAQPEGRATGQVVFHTPSPPGVF